MVQLNMFEGEELERIKELRKLILKYNNEYYNLDDSSISDYEYDNLVVELRKLEVKYKGQIEEFSFNSKIGGTVKSSFEKVNHEIQMQSLSDVFSLEDVEEFLNNIRKEYNDIEFVVDNKIDGLSVSLEYENGVFKRGSTRGDGNIGEDITENLRYVNGIPLKLNEDIDIELRGEVYLSKKDFIRINKELEIEGKKVLSNPRNAAAGTLRQLDVNLVKKRNLSIFIFNIQQSEKNFKTHSESIEYVKNLGIKVIDLYKVCKSNNEVLEYIQYIGSKRSSLEYDIDGAVVKVNNIDLREEIGSTIKVPKWAIAYKYPPEQKESQILDVIWSVGRTGKVTPMASLKPTFVAGSVISSVTLHNYDYIKSKDIMIGDKCIIHKAGDVIPEVDKVIKDKRDGSETEVIQPTNCPSCNSVLEKSENIVDIKCINEKCDAKILRNIIHFVSRDAMNIDGMGESIVVKLVDENKIKDVSDIYGLTFEDFMSLEKFKEKSSSNLINAINNTKNNTLDKLIFGLGIDTIGKRAAKTLSINFNDIYEIINSSKEDLISLEDFGEIMASNIINYFNKEENLKMVNKLESLGVNIKGNKIKLDSKIFENKIFCVTGSFDMKRKDIIEKIEKNGGKVSSSVSKKTNYLINGENSGSKLEKAKSLNINIISLEEFLELIRKGE